MAEITQSEDGKTINVSLDEKKIRTWIQFFIDNWKVAALAGGALMVGNSDRIYNNTPALLPYIIKCECCGEGTPKPVATEAIKEYSPPAVQPDLAPHEKCIIEYPQPPKQEKK